MTSNPRQIEGTPSVYFNFDQSNFKSDAVNNHSNHGNQDFLFQYSDTGYKEKQEFQTPIIKQSVHNEPAFFIQNSEEKLFRDLKSFSKKQQSFNSLQEVKKSEEKLNTQEFFDSFENNFIVKFGDSPLQYHKNQDFQISLNPDDQSDQKRENNKKGSHLSEPFEINLHRNEQILNQESLQEIQNIDVKLRKKRNSSKSRGRMWSNKENCKENKVTEKKNKGKFPFEIRKRVVFKNQQNLANKCKNKGKAGRKLINSQNLMIVTTSGWGGWSGITSTKNQKQEMKSQPIKSLEKTTKKGHTNIFNSHQMFRETLRSTTLDNWKKKFTVHKSSIQKRSKGYTIFQKPFGIR